MPDKELVADHYTHGSLLESIRAGVNKLGKTTNTVTVEDLGPVDEFHIGGRIATKDFLDQLEINADDHVLDVGCGLGGASRFAAQTHGCRVTGVDLTAEYIETGTELCSWVGLGKNVTLQQGDATNMRYADASFDKAYMMHVGMNIAAKGALVSELARVLRPGGKLGIYDVMLTGNDELQFPVPWATTAEGNAVSAPTEYKEALKAAGLRIYSERDRREFATEFFAQLKAKMAGQSGPPPLGLHILMGPTAPEKVKNMIENIALGRVSPFEIIAQRIA